jgi:hypothetical protein
VAAWLKKCLIDYARSDAFNPVQSLSREQLISVIDAPLISAVKQRNEGVNVNDPATRKLMLNKSRR